MFQLRHEDTKNAFSFNGRGVHSLIIPEEDFNIHLFLDMDLLVQEIADITKRTEKKIVPWN